MLPAHRILSAVALTLVSVASFASTTTYTSTANFQNHVSAGAYTESFDGMGLGAASPLPFSGGAFSYSVASDTGIYLGGDFLGANQEDSDLTITFTSGNVTAIGANFFATNISDAFQSVQITIKLSDGTIEAFTPTSLNDTFRGFVSDVAIASLLISGPGTSLYAGLDNLTVGTVPEPTSLALVGLAAAGLFASRRRSA